MRSDISTGSISTVSSTLQLFQWIIMCYVVYSGCYCGPHRALYSTVVWREIWCVIMNVLVKVQHSVVATALHFVYGDRCTYTLLGYNIVVILLELSSLSQVQAL